MENENADDDLPSFGRYQTLRLLGEGAMASVFLAKDPRLSRRVAIKVIKPHLLESESALQRFRTEASILANLRHVNILQVHDYDVEDDMHFLVMEFVEGPGFQSLLNELRGRPLPPQVAAYFLNQAALGLAAAHKQGLVHRDIKPDNMLLTMDGTLKIADFGIAHMADLNLTQAGDILGTPYYMAPEQTLAETPVPETDLWALGVVLYYCLTGRRPFEGNGFTEIKQRIRSGAYRPVSEAAGAMGAVVDPELVFLVDILLSQEPSRRGTAQELSTRLERYLEATGIQDMETHVRDFLAGVIPSVLDRTTVEFQVPKADSGLSGGTRRKSTTPQPHKVSWLRQYALAWIFPLVMIVGTQLYTRWNMANPAIPKAILEIESSPQGAAILLDGEDIGITPMSQHVKPGSYRLKITHGSFPGQVKDTSVFLGSGFAKVVFRFKR